MDLQKAYTSTPGCSFTSALLLLWMFNCTFRIQHGLGNQREQELDFLSYHRTSRLHFFSSAFSHTGAGSLCSEAAPDTPALCLHVSQFSNWTMKNTPRELIARSVFVWALLDGSGWSGAAGAPAVTARPSPPRIRSQPGRQTQAWTWEALQPQSNYWVATRAAN